MATSLKNITNQQIQELLVILGGCIFAMYAGNYIAEENYVPIVAVLGVLAAGAFFFKMGTDMYLMIPVCWGLTGSISVLPLPFNVRQLMILMATALFVAGYIFKVGQKYKIHYETIDLWIWINLFYLFTAFVRNPVGFAAIGGGARVGGKPYVDVLIGVAAYLILSRFRMPLNFATKLPLLTIGVAAFSCFAGGMALFFPGVSNLLGRFYSDFVSFMESDASTLVAGESRFGFLTGLGLSLCLFVVSRNNPVKLISPMNLRWLLIYVCGVLFVLFSGFRNGIFQIFFMTAVASHIREKWEGVAKIIVCTMLLGLCGVLVSYTSFKLPFTFQRALCFLPGDWDAGAVRDAKESSEWRFEIWRIVLTTDKYIQSKVFGDGFGFSRDEYERCMYALMNGTKAYEGENADQEAFMIDGDFHSGPIGTIRFVGYVGLALFLPLLFMQALYSYRLIQTATGTPYLLVATFFAIPAIMHPFIFIFIFGDFRVDLVTVLFNVGMLKLIYNSLDPWRISKVRNSSVKVGRPQPVAKGAAMIPTIPAT